MIKGVFKGLDNQRFNKKNTLIICVFICFIVTILIFAFSSYIKNIGMVTTEQTEKKLRESAEQSAAVVRERLDSSFRMLYATATLLKKENFDDEKIQQILDATEESARFEELVLLKPQDVGFINRNAPQSTRSPEFFEKSMLGNKVSHVVATNVNGEESIVLSVPVVNDSNEIIGILQGIFYLKSFKDLINISIYGGQGYAYIVDSKGDFIIDSERVLASSKKNILRFLSECKIVDGDSISKMKSNMSHDKSGFVFYHYNDYIRIASYVPLGVNDWYIFAAAPGSVVMHTKEILSLSTIYFALKLIIVFIFILAFIVITHRKSKKEILRAKVELEKSEVQLKMLLEQSNEITFEIDIAKKMITYSQKYRETFGGNVIMEDFPQCICEHGTIEKDSQKRFLLEYEKVLKGEEKSSTFEAKLLKFDQYIWCEVLFISIRDEYDRVATIIGRIVDIDAEKNETIELVKKSKLDSMTDLYNKSNTHAEIDFYLKDEGKRSSHTLLVIDLDNFKSINDNFGHLEGDDVIVSFAHSLRKAFPHNSIIGRIGGDEFVVLLKNNVEAKEVQERIKKLGTIFKEQCKHVVTSSIGGATYPDSGQDYVSLFFSADKSLYEAKAKGKDCFMIHSRNM